ncbi:MAG: glycine betaine ABC transporter substrate-binding protein [Oscillospiraceae bacterium]
MKKLLSFSLVLMLLLSILSGCSGKDNKTVIVGGKSYTEAQLTSEIIAQLLEKKTDLKVERKYDMASAICFESINRGDIHIYPEYTGGMLLAYLEQEIEPGTDPQTTYDKAKAGFKEKFDLVVLESMGFNNTYANAISREFAEANNIRTNSDLAPFTPQLSYGAEHSFFDRMDGYENMCAIYGFQFAKEVKMNVALKYQSMEEGLMDVVNVYTTDGLLSQLDVVVLEDDKNFFPAYYCCPVVRQDILDKYPEIETALACLKDCVTEEDMIRYNSLVDNGKMTIPVAAEEFIKEFGLLDK